MINLRIMATNMVAIHTSTITIVNTLLNLFSTNPAVDYVPKLREECDSILAADNGVWTKLGLNRMIRIDSAIRESLRFSSLSVAAFERAVAAPDGLDIGNGVIVPKGAHIALPMHMIHEDESRYENAKQYDPLRFSRPREEYETSLQQVKHEEPAEANGTKASGGKRDMKRTLELKNQSAVTPGEGFLSFGHGKHACPGRFFAANEIKLMLAFIVQNYEVKFLEKRPEPEWLLGAAVPGDKSTLWIKRRKVGTK